MKKLKVSQTGFIPMMLSIIGVVLFIIYLVYVRVAHQAH
jgi:hypothetical protein